ncbi:MAG: acetate--CoA ligase family protein [Candidatus Rokubacteria bacterium]|nr:acetate--CoA ligase family protein [Candidatus Rokubacteria bacterium]
MPHPARGAASLAPFFDPRSVAVIGASRDPSKVGGSVLANLRSAGFAGRVVPVNARAETVQGLPAVPSILAVDGPIDLAVIAVDAAQVLSTLKECVAHGVPGAVVISAGFREIPGEGQTREAELRAWLGDQPIRVLGPNCLGWIRPLRRLNVTFAPGMPSPGGIAFISHSGALAVAILDWSRDRRMGFSLFASLGNQADVTETDVLRAAADDGETRVIVLYLEGVADGRSFFEALRHASPLKPVVVLKAGRTPEGARAVSSHTGALAGSDQAFDAAVRQAGAVRAGSIEGLFDLARALASQPLPRGRRFLAVTNGGGLGIVATDAAREAGLTVAPLGDEVARRLRAVLPPTASVANPVDLVGDADAARFSNALHVLGESREADATLVLLTAQSGTESVNVARAIVAATRDWTIPIAAALVGGPRVAPGAAALEEGGVPCYPFPERAVAALSGMALLADRRRSLAAPPGGGPFRASVVQAERRDTLAAPPGGDPFRASVVSSPGAGPLLAAFQSSRRQLGLLDLQPLLETYGIRVAAARRASAPEEAAAVAALIGFPVALKLVSPDLTHKTEMGGVRLGLESREEVREAAATMLARVRGERPDARVEGFLLQPMVEPGVELLLGAVRDPQFGPVIVVGFGGIYVEVLRDTAARLAPLARGEALAMLDELRMAPVLRGARGGAPVDRAALAETIWRFAQLVVDLPDLAEIELNPLTVGRSGAIAVDARATLAPSP